MCLMSDSAYAYAFWSLYIYGPLALKRSVKSISQVILTSNVTLRKSANVSERL